MAAKEAKETPVLNMFARLAKARKEFHALPLKKSGWNSFSRYKYFELQDFIVPAMQALEENGLVPVVSYTKDEAVMRVWDMESSDSFVITSPMVKAKYTLDDGTIVIQGANLKASHPIQNLGAVETYQRRYLWIALMEIMEHDAIDATAGEDDDGADNKSDAESSDMAARKTPLRKPAKKKLPPKPKADDDGIFDDAPPAADAEQESVETASSEEELVIDTEQDAIEVTDLLIQLTRAQGNKTMDGLISMWKRNKKVIDLLDGKYPKQYERLKTAFSEIKSNLSNAEEQSDV